MANADPGPSRHMLQDIPLVRHLRAADMALDARTRIREDISRIDQEILVLHRKKARMVAQLHTRQDAQEEEEVEHTLFPSPSPEIQELINYNQNHEWTVAMKKKMFKVFGIPRFRTGQAGVCNAVMDQRNVFCCMQTGAGKSLCFQLPALLMPGCTVVIAPLLSLIEDQIAHLNKIKVKAIMFTSTNAEEHDALYHTLLSEEEVKLCYVTPEKIANSSMFCHVIDQLFKANKLARIVVDEAHCVVQDQYRPHYREIGKFKDKYPDVPMTALSATCPSDILKNILEKLHLYPVVKSTDVPCDDTKSTILFMSSQPRKNLIYKVNYKPDKFEDQCRLVTSYILDNWASQSGIIYCHSTKETEELAAWLKVASNNAITAKEYHAKLGKSDRKARYSQWIANEFHIMCATTALGLGIDKPDVRFVIHFTLPKNILGLYQESGRAGRDAKEAECLLYYRPQDVSNIASLTTQSSAVMQTISLVQYAQNIEQCRLIQLSSALDCSGFLGTSQQTAYTDCGRCDNCTRDPDSIVTKDVTFAAWIVVAAVQKNNIPLTALIQAVKNMDGWNTMADPLHPKDLQWLCMKLVAEDYLTFFYKANQHRVNTYFSLGKHSSSLTVRSQEDICSGSGHRIYCTFDKALTARKKWTRQLGGGNQGAPREGQRGGERQAVDEVEQHLGIRYLTVEDSSDDEQGPSHPPAKRQRVAGPSTPEVICISDSD